MRVGLWMGAFGGRFYAARRGLCRLLLPLSL